MGEKLSCEGENLRKLTTAVKSFSLQEVLMTFAVSTRSSLYNRLIWIFKLYDSDRDGILSQKDVALVVKSVYDLLGPCTPPVTPEAIEEHVEWLFQVTVLFLAMEYYA